MMLWIGIACATAVVAWHQVALVNHNLRQYDAGLREADRELNTLKAELQSLREKRLEADLSFKRLTRTVTELQLTREAADADAAESGTADGGRPAEADEKAAERARQAVALRRWADGYFTAAADDAAQSAQLLRGLARYVVRTLEQEAATATAGPHIVRCGLYAQQPSVLDIGPALLGEFRDSLNADLMYRQADGGSGIKFYWRWPGGPTPSLKLGSMLNELVHGDGAEDTPGAEQLKAVLRAIYEGGPSLVQIGPLLVARTEAGMSAGFVAASWAGLDAEQRDAAISGSRPDLLAELGATGIQDLTGWALLQPV
jgi:hypothetical protein